MNSFLNEISIAADNLGASQQNQDEIFVHFRNISLYIDSL